jgi:hypothetical protein
MNDSNRTKHAVQGQWTYLTPFSSLDVDRHSSNCVAVAYATVREVVCQSTMRKTLLALFTTALDDILYDSVDERSHFIEYELAAASPRSPTF